MGTVTSVPPSLLHSPLLAPQGPSEPNPGSRLPKPDRTPGLPVASPRNFCICLENPWRLNQSSKSLMVKYKAVRKTKGGNILVEGREKRQGTPDQPRYEFCSPLLTFRFLLHGRNESRPTLNGNSCYQNPQVISTGKLTF